MSKDYSDLEGEFLDYREDPNIKLAAKFFSDSIDRIVLDELKRIALERTIRKKVLGKPTRKHTRWKRYY